MTPSTAEIVREYGPFPGLDAVGGVTYDGERIWFASGGALNALDPESGATMRTIEVAAHAGTAFDGRYLYQIAEDRIQKIEPTTGEVLTSIPSPGSGSSGLAWAEGALWVGQYRSRTIHQVDPETGATLRVIESNRFVTGVTWVDGELWHGTWEGDGSDVRRIDPQSGEVLERLEMPAGTMVSGLESDGGDRLFCGGGASGKIRSVRRPKRADAGAQGAEASAT
ncbi:MAG: glutamine cyclotransferase [Gemmatimonadota bacterium]